MIPPKQPHVFTAVDMGSNTVKVCTWEITAGVQTRVLWEHRFPIRLARGTFASGAFSPELMEAALDCLREIRAKSDAHGATTVRAVATAAMRQASNAEILRRRIAEETGIEIEVISPEREGELTAKGALWEIAKSGAAPTDLCAVVVDIGGGSAELTHIETDCEGDLSSRSTVSLPLGAARLTEAFLPDEPPTPEQLIRLVRHIDEVSEEAGVEPAAARLIGCGGTLVSVGLAVALDEGKLTGGGLRENPLASIPPLSLTALEHLIEEMLPLSVEDRAERFGLERQRAEVVIAGGKVLVGLLCAMGKEEIRISRAGNREGLLSEHLLSLRR
jgi:exopolyphosphatase / guanosine-5'-triphosphate,3'-diphosphate pyrophosphatase